MKKGSFFYRMKKVVCFGDSLTQQGYRPGGWLCLLAEAYETKADVVNRGFSGYNTNLALLNAYDIAFAEYTSKAPDVVLICFGANDAAMAEREVPPNGPQSQHVPVELYSANLNTLVERLKKQWNNNNTTTIVLVSPPSVNDTLYAEHCAKQGLPLPTRTKATSRLYRDACEHVAKQHHVLFADSFSAFEPSDASLFTDGLHLSGAGNSALFRCVLETLANDANHPSRMPNAFPHWKEALVVVNAKK